MFENIALEFVNQTVTDALKSLNLQKSSEEDMYFDGDFGYIAWHNYDFGIGYIVSKNNIVMDKLSKFCDWHGLYKWVKAERVIINIADPNCDQKIREAILGFTNGGKISLKISVI